MYTHKTSIGWQIVAASITFIDNLCTYYNTVIGNNKKRYLGNSIVSRAAHARVKIAYQ